MDSPERAVYWREMSFIRVLAGGVALISTICMFACTRAPSAEKVVNISIWSNYLTPEIVDSFTKHTGIKVQIANFSSNEELLAKIQAGASQYDIVVPSDYMVYTLAKLNLLRALDYSKLPNAKLLDPRYLKKPYDPENKFSLPFDWGTTGIAVNRILFAGQIHGWKDVLENPALAGKFTLLDDVRETIGVALRLQGSGINTTNEAELNKARDLLKTVRPKIKAFTSETVMSLVNGDSAVSQAYVSDALLARSKTGGNIEYVLPQEGCTFWTDNLVIPASAPHPEAAYAFLDYLLSAKVSAATVLAVFVAPTNRDVLPLLPSDLQMDPNLYPAAGAISRCEMIRDLGESLSKWDRAWTEIKAGGT